MKGRKLSLSALALLLLSTSAIESAFAFGRGTGGVGRTDDGPQDVRDPHLWNGDAFVSPEDKAARYKNYKLPINNAQQNGNPQQGMNVAGNNGSPWGNQTGAGWRAGNTAQPLPVNAVHEQAPDSSAPAHIEQDQYHYFVQTYEWKGKGR